MIPSKVSLPAMANFLFETKEGLLFLTACSDEGQVQTSIECVADAELKFCIPATMLLNALKTLPEQPININVNENNYEVKIIYSGGKFEMIGMNDADYPKPNEFQANDNIVISCQDFLHGICSVQHLAAEDELRPAMCTVFLEIKKENYTFVGTDGHGLGTITKYLHEGTTGGESSLMISKKIAGLLKSIVPSSKDGINIEIGSFHVRLSFSSYEVVFRQPEGKYPNFRSVIPKNDKVLKINVEAFKSAINRVAIFSGTSKSIKFNITKDLLTISAKDDDFSTSGEEIVSCDFDSTYMEIGLKHDLLLSIIPHIHTEHVHIHLNEPNRAVLIFPEENNTDEELLYLLMPYVINY